MLGKIVTNTFPQRTVTPPSPAPAAGTNSATGTGSSLSLAPEANSEATAEEPNGNQTPVVARPILVTPQPSSTHVSSQASTGAATRSENATSKKEVTSSPATKFGPVERAQSDDVEAARSAALAAQEALKMETLLATVAEPSEATATMFNASTPDNAWGRQAYRESMAA